MQLISRRPSPALLVALLALVVAMTGTATAAILVSSPDQLGESVVTNPKIATDAVTSRALDEPSVGAAQLNDGAVTSSKLLNPVFSAKVNADGTTKLSQSEGVDPSLTRKRAPGAYEIGFLRTITNCAVVVNPTAGHIGGAFAPDIGQISDRVITVITMEIEDGTIKQRDTAFNVIAQC
jgi:hypothetical protein